MRKSQILSYSELAQQILISMRGERTQSDLSHQLGYSFNQVGKWESGATQFYWQDFTKLCDILRIDWKEQFNSVFCFSSGMNIEIHTAFEILSHFFGERDLEKIGHYLNKSKSTVSRLFNDSVKLDFADVLKMADHRQFVLINWVSKFVDVKKIPLLTIRFEEDLALYRGFISIPWAPLVNAALGLAEYKSLPKHSDAWLAERTGLTAEQVQTGLKKLVESEIAYFQNGHYHNIAQEMTFLKIPEYRKVTHFYSEMVTKAFKETPPKAPNLNNPSLVSSRIYPLSASAGKKISELIIQYHHQIADIIKENKEPADHVRLILFHCIDMALCAEVSKNETATANMETFSKPLEIR